MARFLANKSAECVVVYPRFVVLQSRVFPISRCVAKRPIIDRSIKKTPEKLRELWIIPIFFVIVTVVSMGVAFFLSFTFRLKPSQRYAYLHFTTWLC